MNAQVDLIRKDRLHLAPLAVTVIILFRIPVPVSSQRLILGVKVAGQVTSTFVPRRQGNPVTDEDRFLFGPMAEVRLWRRLSFEVDGLYKRKLDYNQNMIIPDDPTQFRETFVTTDVTSRSWEVPVLAKWRVLEHRHSVFVGGGLSSRKVNGSAHTYGTTVSLVGFPPTSVVSVSPAIGDDRSGSTRRFPTVFFPASIRDNQQYAG